MWRNYFFILSLGLALMGLTAHACELPSRVEPIFAEEGSAAWVARWDANPFALLDVPAPPLQGALKDYLARAESHGLDLNQRALLLRQRGFYERRFPDQLRKIDAILKGEWGRIVPLGCWESLLLESFLTAVDLSHGPGEFEAYFLETDRGELKIYFHAVKGLAIPSLLELESRISEEVRRGARLRVHLHLHPWVWSQFPQGDVGGTLVPSGNPEEGADVGSSLRMARQWGLQEVWITNGKETWRSQTSEINRFFGLTL